MTKTALTELQYSLLYLQRIDNQNDNKDIKYWYSKMNGL